MIYRSLFAGILAFVVGACSSGTTLATSAPTSVPPTENPCIAVQFAAESLSARGTVLIKVNGVTIASGEVSYPYRSSHQLCTGDQAYFLADGYINGVECGILNPRTGEWLAGAEGLVDSNSECEYVKRK